MKEIEALELRERLENGEPFQIVDIREADEFGSWNILGSVNLPVYNALRAQRDDALTGRAAELDRQRPVVAVCRAGFISVRAAELLEGLGYEALSLRGGIRGWNAVWSEASVPLGEGARCLQVRRNGKGCLSYMFGRGAELAVVDPALEASVFVDIAEREGARITHVLETHVHADHLSRARELCRRTGAKLLLQPNRRVTFTHDPVNHGDELRVAGMTVRVLATPGHTGESVCYELEGQLLLSGDTLFVGSVGRPDLERGDAGAERGAHLLYHSLHEQLLPRSAELQVLAAHHGGAIGFDRVPIAGKLGELRDGLDLLAVDEATFVERVLASLQSKPANHEAIIAINEGKADLGRIDPLDLEAGPNRCAAG